MIVPLKSCEYSFKMLVDACLGWSLGYFLVIYLIQGHLQLPLVDLVVLLLQSDESP